MWEGNHHSICLVSNSAIVIAPVVTDKNVGILFYERERQCGGDDTAHSGYTSSVSSTLCTWRMAPVCDNCTPERHFFAPRSNRRCQTVSGQSHWTNWIAIRASSAVTVSTNRSRAALLGEMRVRVRKKAPRYFCPLTLPNAGRFSTFFHRHARRQISSKAIIKCPTTPRTHRYSTLWCPKNRNNLKHVLWLTTHHNVVVQRDLGVVGPLTVTLFQVYRWVDLFWKKF